MSERIKEIKLKTANAKREVERHGVLGIAGSKVVFENIAFLLAELEKQNKQITDIIFDLSTRTGNMVPNTPYYEALTCYKEDLMKVIGL
ncbi:MAG: hypothetical protein KAS32_19065 [Candidatus Peribacteraceae bacterium]|nr:hypothetical protein [Candidatus Peribacteraceae bacterium]